MHRRLVVVVSLLLLLAAGCGGGDDDGGGSTIDGSVDPTEAPTGGGGGDGGGDGGGGEAAASPEFCAAWNDGGLSGIFITNSPDAIVDAYREYVADLLAVAPDEVKASVQALADLEIDPADLRASASAAEPLIAEIDAFVAENCAAVPEPTFTFVRSEQAGADWVFFIEGTCPDSSFPVDVVGPPKPFGDPVPADDLGGGTYSIAYSVSEGANEEQLLDELFIPDGVEGTCA